MEVTENTTHICLLKAFLFWLENESVEEIENKKCKRSLPLAQITLAQAHTSAWRGSTHCLHFSLFPPHLAPCWHRPGTSLAKANNVAAIRGDSPCSDAVNQFSRNVAYKRHLGHLNYHSFKISRAAAAHCLFMRQYKGRDRASLL